ncbi:MAG: glycogen/starch/alpha-glucan phosphorylase [Clostridiales Family XIII bacterium]|jgi:starch phosphorylase|nr:glycogen/starch/alpha-glucan phosphorylase [Clostridiales Family XIII bacterium]
MTELITNDITKEDIKEAIENKIKRGIGVTLDVATEAQIYKAVGLTIRELIMERWANASKQITNTGVKRLYYLSAEFLMGRALTNNMINLEVFDLYKEALRELGVSLDEVEEVERDAGLGNGGLGRLAACFMDSLSTLEMPVTGCCIRYEHGLFRQKIVDGAQTEVDDNWLEDGSIWEVARPDDKVEVKYGGNVEEIWTADGLKIEHTGYTSVLAYPYDYPVMGYDSKAPGTLRLWSARAKTEIDMGYFNKGDYARAVEESALVEAVSQVLYPEDNHEQGRLLRLKQFYFFTSATMQFLVNRMKKHHGDVRNLPDFYTVQINDTHPTVAIPELIRILMDDEGLQWDEAIDIASRMFNYTNHTIMSEALEKWNENLFKSLLPRIHKIITVIDEKFKEQIWTKWPGDWDKLNQLSIISGGEIRMANLCIAMCSKVNGVSQLHADIIKTNTFRDFYILFPDKFIGITNGITQRRWLAKSNPGLTGAIGDRIGKGFLKDYTQFDRIKDFANDPEFLTEIDKIKRENKVRLRDHLYKKQGIEINPDTMFDVQAKRLHEYKRQLLKLMHILRLYFKLKADPHAHITPATFIFAAKAAPGYYRAKDIIRLILAAGELINNDPDTKDILKIVFIENYSVSEAELLVPATDVSEQISTAGLEASGTGNMKFMLNGAVTMGTMDGANVEIFEAVGPSAIFIFGATVQELEQLERSGTYNPKQMYEENPELKQVLDAFVGGVIPTKSGHHFDDIYNALIFGEGGRADKYYLIYDFKSYDNVYSQLTAAYEDRGRWLQMAAANITGAGVFSSDRTIMDYVNNVWHLDPLRWN